MRLLPRIAVTFNETICLGIMTFIVIILEGRLKFIALEKNEATKQLAKFCQMMIH